MNCQISYRSVQPAVHGRYFQLREDALNVAASTDDSAIEHTDTRSLFQLSERFLQVLWNEQKFAAHLHTLDGRRLEVVVPGTWNLEAGPDFRNAVIRLDGTTLAGDVEVHRNASDWTHHGHDRNPLYRNVILHVIWRAAATAKAAGRLPCLAVADFLERPWRALFAEIDVDSYPYARRVTPGSCAVKWALTDDTGLRRMLRVAGLARFGDKTTRIARQIIAKGADQALYETLFEALGYKANKQAFRRLAEEVPLSRLQAIRDVGAREATLFGAAGLLPDVSVTRVCPFWRRRLQDMWDIWWRQGMPVSDLKWCRSATRPLNSPERRLAAGLALLKQSDFAPAAWLLGLSDVVDSPSQLYKLLEHGLAVRSVWEDYKSFGIKLARPAQLLGVPRVRDLIVNVALPFLNAHAWKQQNSALAELAKSTYLLVPGLQPNRLLREAAHRFLVPPTRTQTLTRRAYLQQGLLEIYRSFCLILRNDCKNCPFVRSFPVEHPSEGE